MTQALTRSAILFPCWMMLAGIAVAQQPETSPPETDLGDPTAIDTQLYELQLNDGSRLRGKLSVGEIRVTTKYGELNIPTRELIRITPGLKTRRPIHDRLTRLLEELGGDDFAARDQAQTRLIEMGPKIESALREMADPSNAEQAAKLKAIFDHFAGLKLTWGEATNQPLGLQDIVTTRQFTVQGKIQAESFDLDGAFGRITVPLASVRAVAQALPFREGDTYQTLSVKGGQLVDINGGNPTQSQPHKTEMIVERGDLISIRATGTATRATTSTSSSTPAGTSNWGTVQSSPRIYGGALLVRVGDSGRYMVAGAKHTFTADATGPLQFGVAMSSTSYKYTHGGEYEVNVRVTRGQ